MGLEWGKRRENVQDRVIVIVLVFSERMMTPQNTVASKNPESGQVTILHLLLGIAFFMPVVAAVSALKRSSGGALRYTVAVPLTLAVGSLIVWLDWKIGKAAWMRSEHYSKFLQNVAALSIVAMDVAWIAVGGVSGSELAKLIAEHVAR